MSAADRDSLAAASRAMLATALSGDAAQLKNESAPDLQKDFAGVANALEQMRAAASGTVTLRDLYSLTATTSAEPSYLCGVYTPDNQVTFALPGLKPGRYAVVFAHVTGTPDPRQITLVLQDEGGWKLAGLIQKPMQQGGHDGLWYWQHARDMARKKQDWGAYLCFQVAQQLLAPAGFVTTTNLEKLTAEAQAARPAEWPSTDKPLYLKVEGASVPVTAISPALSIHNTADLAASAVYTPATASTANPPESQAANVIALQTAIGAELQRKAPDFDGLVTQFLVSSTSNGPTTVVPVKHP